jgi:hypothetical protein
MRVTLKVYKITHNFAYQVDKTETRIICSGHEKKKKLNLAVENTKVPVQSGEKVLIYLLSAWVFYMFKLLR